MISAVKSDCVNVMVCVDSDDDIHAYSNVCSGIAELLVIPPAGSAAAVKHLIDNCKTEYMILGSDDVLFLTEEWAQKLIQAIPDDCIGVSYGGDEWKCAFNHFMFHRRLRELTGVFPAEHFWHFGPDTYVLRVMQEIGRVFYVPEVVISHRHFKNHKAELDDTYRHERSRPDGRAALEALAPQIKKDADILRGAML